ncbi:PREDICTED: DNA repair protein recA homolog 2, mitochondrial isoform X2 [Tarenaya hassleriana]|uniref:DNA repair protein recA homolog 2, mitochondrial isoform X2 n=1 Tax=Tarenaya hassleriana TaxID=28532 RepID=UPI00053C4434|nr:PREDICTED: DNA repair protein recA homolog 2, mitochondrial isoform X2 [Tarenaya hassleriana]
MGRLLWRSVSTSLKPSSHRPFSFFSYCYQNGREDIDPCCGDSSRYLSSVDYELDEVQDDCKATEKDAALHMALSELANDFSKESRLSLKRFFSSRRAEVISTGSLKLDLALGIGGLPKGRIVEVYGKEASGKTTLALHIIKEAQKLGGYCAYLDVENAMDPTLAESVGVNTENLLISRPDSAENLLSIVDVLTKSRSVDVIVVDSVAALAPRQELDVPVGDSYGDIQSRIMTQALRKIHYSLCNSQTLLVFLNQVRSHVKSDLGFGHAEETTCGGNALAFHAAIRLKMMRTGLIRTDNKIIGLDIGVQVVKNKLAPGVKKANLGIHFGHGFYIEREVVELACEHGVMIQEGNSYFVEGEVINGRETAEKYLMENGEVLDAVVKILRRKLFNM